MTREVTAIPESVFRLRVNGLELGTWTCSPHALEALAVGRLRAEGYITGAADLLAVRALPASSGILGVDVEVPPARAAAGIEEREHRTRHGCGPRYLLDCRPEVVRRPSDARADPPDADVFADLFRQLYERAESYRATGGLHTASLSDGERLFHLQEEVGRHNAVDKAIGDAILNHAGLGGLGLVTTARISGEIAAKAARAGLAWIASRSVPTTLATEIAAAGGLAIVARAAGRDTRIFDGSRA